MRRRRAATGPKLVRLVAPGLLSTAISFSLSASDLGGSGGQRWHGWKPEAQHAPTSSTVNLIKHMAICWQGELLRPKDTPTHLVGSSSMAMRPERLP